MCWHGCLACKVEIDCFLEVCLFGTVECKMDGAVNFACYPATRWLTPKFLDSN